MSYVISLSTIPSRFALMRPTLEMLVRQRPAPEAVVLYLPRRYRRFPDWDGALPDVPRGVEIRVVDEDFGPASKVLHALREFAGTQTDILFCDDDMCYRPGWAAAFLKARRKQPGAVIALSGMPVTSYHPAAAPTGLLPRARLHWRATDPEFALRSWWIRWRARNPDYPLIGPGRRAYWKAGHADIFEGYAGVMVRPDFFAPEVFDIPDVARHVDDVWLSGMATVRGTPIWVPAFQREPDLLRGAHSDALHLGTHQGQDRRAQNRGAVEYLQARYGIWT